MAPTVLLAGVIAGLTLPQRSHRTSLVLLGVLVSIAWGALVTIVVDASVFVGGAGLAAANFIVGALVGVTVRAVLRDPYRA